MKHRKFKSRNFSDGYKNELFQLWWKNQKPSAIALHKMIPEEWGSSPSEATVRDWIREEFEDRAAILDKQMMNELEGRMVQEKVAMLYRHGEIGREMQNKALDKLREDGFLENLSANSVVRFLIEGVRIERESVGIPQALEKMLNSTDEEILDEIEKITEESQAEILIIDDESD